jgi:ABC-type amino acid transport system permease subunit
MHLRQSNKLLSQKVSHLLLNRLKAEGKQLKSFLRAGIKIVTFNFKKLAIITNKILKVTFRLMKLYKIKSLGKIWICKVQVEKLKNLELLVQIIFIIKIQKYLLEQEDKENIGLQRIHLAKAILIQKRYRKFLVVVE